tara:strand:- start:217 stop:507 length:291 start_codon:yes stop_codon:yes gene_type:complete
VSVTSKQFPTKAAQNDKVGHGYFVCMYDFMLRLLMNEKKRVVGFRVILEEEEIAQIHFYCGLLVPDCCILQHRQEEFHCKDRTQALQILTERLNND